MTNGQETEYREGEKVVVITWCEEKIVKPKPGTPVLDPGYYVVEFRDGMRAVVDADHIRPGKLIETVNPTTGHIAQRQINDYIAALARQDKADCIE